MTTQLFPVPLYTPMPQTKQVADLGNVDIRTQCFAVADSVTAMPLYEQFAS
jgi:hypothetical protein